VHCGFASAARAPVLLATVFTALKALLKRLRPIAIAAAIFRSALPVGTAFVSMGAFSSGLRGGLRALFITLTAEMRSRSSCPTLRGRFPTRALFSLLTAPFAASVSARFPAWPFSRVLAAPIVPSLCAMPSRARFPWTFAILWPFGAPAEGALFGTAFAPSFKANRPPLLIGNKFNLCGFASLG
jgi:hypothetical protein